MGIYLDYLSSILVFIPIGLGIYYLMRNNSDSAFNILISIFFVWGIVELILIYLTLLKANNHFWMNLQCVITTSLFIVYYSLTKLFKREYLYYLLAFYLGFAFIWFQFFGSIHIWSVPFIIVSNMILIAFSAYSLIQLINMEQENIFRLYEFWINTGVLVYFTGTLVYMSFFPILMNSHDKAFNNNVQNVHTVINIIGNLLYTIAFLCRIRMYKVKFSLQ